MTRAAVFPTRELLFAGFVLTTAVLLSGCNTMEGFGQDVQSGGEAVEDAAEDAGS